MYHSRRLAPAQVQQAIQDYQNGLVGQALASKYGVARATMDCILRGNGMRFRPVGANKRLYTLDEGFFGSIDTEAKAYVLGFLYGDGAVTPLISAISATGPASDEQIYRDMAKVMGSNRPLRRVMRPKAKQPYIIFTVASIRMRSDLYRLGVVPNKTKTLTFPTAHVPSHLHRHFIRGLFDADGCITAYPDRRCNRINAYWNIFSTREILTTIKDVLDAHDIKTNALVHDKRCYANSAILGTCRAASLHDIYHFLYDGATICLNRKRERFTAILAQKPREGLVAARRQQAHAIASPSARLGIVTGCGHSGQLDRGPSISSSEGTTHSPLVV